MSKSIERAKRITALALTFASGLGGVAVSEAMPKQSNHPTIAKLARKAIAAYEAPSSGKGGTGAIMFEKELPHGRVAEVKLASRGEKNDRPDPDKATEFSIAIYHQRDRDDLNAIPIDSVSFVNPHGPTGWNAYRNRLVLNKKPAKIEYTEIIGRSSVEQSTQSIRAGKLVSDLIFRTDNGKFARAEFRELQNRADQLLDRIIDQ